MTKITIYNIQKAITPKKGKPKLWFLCSVCHLMMVNISVKLHKKYLKSFSSYRADTILWQSDGGQTDRQTSMRKTKCLLTWRGKHKYPQLQIRYFFQTKSVDIFLISPWKHIQWNLDNSKSKGPNSFVWIIETLNNWGLKCIHILQLGLQNDFELLRIFNNWSLNYRGSTVLWTLIRSTLLKCGTHYLELW